MIAVKVKGSIVCHIRRLTEILHLSFFLKFNGKEKENFIRKERECKT
jgi:hypothetical protein